MESPVIILQTENFRSFIMNNCNAESAEVDVKQNLLGISKSEEKWKVIGTICLQVFTTILLLVTFCVIVSVISTILAYFLKCATRNHTEFVDIETQTSSYEV